MIYDPSRSDPLLELGRRNFANQPSAQSPRQRHRHGCSRVTSQLCALCGFLFAPRNLCRNVCT
jgi:hypothetical protein